MWLKPEIYQACLTYLYTHVNLYMGSTAVGHRRVWSSKSLLHTVGGRVLSEVNINVSDGIGYIDSLYSVIIVWLWFTASTSVSAGFQTSLCMGQICCTVHSCIKCLFIKDPKTLVCNRCVNSEGQTKPKPQTFPDHLLSLKKFKTWTFLMFLLMWMYRQ